MNWNTIYITGRSDFREEVKKKLENSDVNFMPGYVDNSGSRFMHDLYWLDEKVDLRRFKEAIGSKLIWKYRLSFYMNLEEFIQARNKKENSLELTKEDLDLIASMQSAA
jgi:intergrase/recombinase